MVHEGGADWAQADAAMSHLDGVVAWGKAIGHRELDEADEFGSGYTSWQATFGALTTGRFDDQPWFRGASTDELDTWQIVEVGAVDYLFLNLQLDVPDASIAWAQEVIDAHPGVATVVSTHVGRGALPSPHFPGPGRNSADQVWTKLIAPNNQIFLVLTGHASDHTVATKDHCQPVLEMSVDPPRPMAGSASCTSTRPPTSSSARPTRRCWRRQTEARRPPGRSGGTGTSASPSPRPRRKVSWWTTSPWTPAPSTRCPSGPAASARSRCSTTTKSRGPCSCITVLRQGLAHGTHRDPLAEPRVPSGARALGHRLPARADVRAVPPVVRRSNGDADPVRAPHTCTTRAWSRSGRPGPSWSRSPGPDRAMEYTRGGRSR